MSFSFFKARPKTPQEVARATKEGLMALDTPTVAEVKALEKERLIANAELFIEPLTRESGSRCSFVLDRAHGIVLDRAHGIVFSQVRIRKKALEEVEKNFSMMKFMLCGDGESEPNTDQILQLALELCKEDVIPLIIHKLLVFDWQARKDVALCWSVLLRQQVETTYCCVEYIENHLDLLDFLVVCYDNKDAALTCGSMLRECIKFPTLAKYILESASFQLFFKYVELPNFDVASDAFATFKDLLTKHGEEVAEYLTSHYDEFFEMYEKLLTSSNYVTRRQSLKLLTDFLLEPPNSHIMKRYILEIRYLKVIMTLLKDSSKNIQLSAFHIFKVFVANPHKTQEIKIILAKNCDRLLDLLRSLSVGKGSEDDQFEEEKELIMKEIEKVSRLINRNG